MLIVSSRSTSSADALASELRNGHPGAQIQGVRLDQSSIGFRDVLKRLNPDVVLHTAGPYQGQDYRVAEACIECRSHYVDLADGRQFIEGFTTLNAAAAASGVLLLTGVSTLPGLSSVVVDYLSDRFHSILGIEISIAPAHQTPRGKGTIAAVLSYCGKPFRVLVQGNWETKYGWHDLKIQRYPELGVRLSGACDVPDLFLMPKYVPGVRSVTFHAALEAPWEQLTLWLMGLLGKYGVVNSWDRFTPLFANVSKRLVCFGSDIGGMHIRVSGTEVHGARKTVTWYLTARRNHGPEIPCSPALIIARKLVRNEISERGAHPCLGMFALSEFDDEVRNLDIRWQLVDSAPQ